MKFSSIGNRKLLATIALFLVASTCMFLKIATFGEWSEFMIWIFGIYASGNVVEHATKRIGVKVTPKEEITE